MIATTLKPRKSKVCKCGCGERFVPTRQIQPTRDNYDCKVRYAEKVAAKSAAKREQLERAEFKKRREAAKRTCDLRQEAQDAFHRWIREGRDKDEPCISCGRANPVAPLTGGAWDCGHYRSCGAAKNLAFDERNVAKQCKSCNRDKEGNRDGFRLGLIARHGIEFVEALEADNDPRRLRADDYRRIRDESRARLRALRKEREALAA